MASGMLSRADATRDRREDVSGVEAIAKSGVIAAQEDNPNSDRASEALLI